MNPTPDTESSDQTLPSPRDIARQSRLDILRRNGYSEARVAALENQTPAPDVPEVVSLPAVVDPDQPVWEPHLATSDIVIAARQLAAAQVNYSIPQS